MRCSCVSILLLSALSPSAAKAESKASADAATEMIPNTLMQSDKEPPSAESIAPWTRHGTGLNVTFLDDCAGERYLETAWGSQFANAFRSLRSGAFKYDFLRLAYIADRGGFYADTDSCAVDVTLETLRQRAALSNASLILTESYWKPKGKQYMFNGFFAARPKHAALIRLAHMAVHNIEKRLGANSSAKSPAPGFCDCSDGCCAMAIAGPALMHHLFKEPDILVLPEVDRGEVFDPASKRTVLKKCKKDATKAVYWDKQFEHNQIYWPEDSSPTSACDAHPDAQAEAQPQTLRPQLMIMHGGHFYYEPFVRTLADGVAALPSASAWSVSVHTLAGPENGMSCDDSTTPSLVRKHTSQLKAGDIFVFVGPFCANQVPWPELKARQPDVLRVFWQVEPYTYLSHDCERYLGFNSINAWFSTPSRYDCSFCAGGKFPKDAGKMILLNKQAEAADLLDDPVQKAQSVSPMESSDAAHHVARVHKRREALHETSLRLLSDYNQEDHAAEWHIDEIWEYSRQTLDVCSGGYRPPVSRHVPAAALSEEADAEAKANGAGRGWWAKRMAKIARARGAPLRKLVFFGNTNFGQRKTCYDILEAGLQGTGIQLVSTTSITDWRSWVKAVGDPSAVFLNMHKDCLDASTEEGKMRAEESHTELSDMVYGQPLEPRVGLLLGAAGLVISQRAHPGDMRLYHDLANFTTLAEIPSLVRTLQAMPPASRQKLAMWREAVFRRDFSPSKVLQYAKIDQLLIERERLHEEAQLQRATGTKPARMTAKGISKRASTALQPSRVFWDL